MKKLFYILYLVLSLIGVTPAYAGDDDMPYMGPGTMTCQQFEAVNSLGVQGKVLAGNFFSWAQGFMSAANGARQLDGNSTKNLNSMPIAQQQQILNRFCIGNPTKPYVAGVVALFSQLDDSTDDDTDAGQ